ncbi:hypothetical protein SOVF_205030 [Spinacia oleracea]|nr:hypothetical protein SOVF_205030 [Spinacia oleracea]
MSKIMFEQRYFIDKSFWAGSNSKTPLIVYLGGEDPIDNEVQAIGVINQAAPKFRALVLYIEHRFYGVSVPFGSIDIALGDLEVRRCLTSEQALVDFAKIIIDVKKKLLDQHVPVVVIGCSYSGILAAWFRLKYPNITIGALASSAPVYFDMDVPFEYDFFSVVSNDYKIVNQKCYDRIQKSWAMIDNIGRERAQGHSYLTELFKTCNPLVSVEALKLSLVSYYTSYAQYNGRYNGGINGVCEEIVKASDDDLLGGIARSAIDGFSCYNVDYFMANTNTSGSSFNLDNATKAWNWQVCSEFIFRNGVGNDTMFQPEPFNLTIRLDYCNTKYHIRPRTHWVSTYFNGYVSFTLVFIKFTLVINLLISSLWILVIF